MLLRNLAIRRLGRARSFWARVRGHRSSGQSGQSLTEQGLLLATLLGGLAVGGIWLMRTHPDMMNAINIHVRGFYFALSLPFP